MSDGFDVPILDGYSVIDTSEDRPTYLVQSRRGAYIRMAPTSYQLLTMRRRGLSDGEIARRLSAGGHSVTPTQVAEACQRVAESVRRIDNGFRPATGAFWFRLPLLSASIVCRIAGILRSAFSPAVAIPFVIAASCVLARALPGTAIRNTTPSEFWGGYGLFCLSLLAHELGHATACRRYGAAPAEIGLTVYLIYPAFYSNVTDAWRLRRLQRVVVDSGGIYFQGLIAALYACAGSLTGAKVFEVSVAMIAGSCVFSLNPIFKFDGYWLLADSLGVTNLSRQPIRVARFIMARLAGRHHEPLRWPRAIAATVGVYSILSVAVWGRFIIWVFPVILTNMRRYPVALLALVKVAHAGAAGHGPAPSVSQFLMSTALTVTGIFGLWRVGLRLRQWTKAALRLLRGLPRSHRAPA